MTTQTTPRDGTVEVNGLRLHYLDWGNEEAPPMLLLHGTSSHARVWDHFGAALSDAFHVVALDARGHGDSESPPDYLTGYRQEYWISDIDGIVSALNLKPMVLVGLSTGANNAMHYTAAHPEAVERLIVIEMGPEVMRAGVASVSVGKPSREEFDTQEEGMQFLMAGNRRADPELFSYSCQNIICVVFPTAVTHSRATRLSDTRTGDGPFGLLRRIGRPCGRSLARLSSSEVERATCLRSEIVERMKARDGKRDRGNHP